VSDNSKTEYRSTVKATSLFGGVQVFNILIQIIRSKIIAVLLGTAGMGISGLYLSATTLIASFTQLGLGTSAVKNIAAADSSGNTTRLAIVIKIFQRLIWVTGILGTLATLIFASQLSQRTFGDSKHTIAFLWLSITLLINQLTSGHNVLLQGMRRLNQLAKSSLYGNLLGLLLTVPLYYFYGIDGIVPAIIITSVVALLFSWNYSRKVKLEQVAVTPKQVVTEGKDMVKMGVLISMGGILTALSSYIIRIFINDIGGEGEVGLYNAGFVIINTYVGLIFTAMSTEYYPRLSAMAQDNKRCSRAVNHQAEVAILMIAPILVVFMVFIKWILIILYSDKFIPVEGMLHWCALGMFFKVAAWCIGFVFLAKGHGKLFFINELLGNIYILLANIWGYSQWGLTGLGIAFLLSYALYFLQVFIIVKKQYNISYGHKFIVLFIVQFSICLLCFIIINKYTILYAYIVGSVLFLISLVYSYIELDKRIGVKEILSKFRQTKQNK